MIYARRRTDMALTEAGWLPRSRVLLGVAHSLAQRLSRNEDAQSYLTQQVRNSEKDRPMPMEGSIPR
jgi:hypothetical protein